MAGPTAGRRVAVRTPEAGIQLPVDEPGDLGSWAVTTAYARLTGSGAPFTDGHVRSLADALLAATEDSRSRNVTLAISLCPHPQAGELARIEVRDFAPSAGVPELPSPQEFAEWLAAPGQGALEEPDVVYGELPLGPAVRIKARQLGDPDVAAEAPIVWNDVYFVRPRQADIAIALSVTWVSGMYEDAFGDLCDRLAQSLVLT
jgi:hypothetical protein